MKNKILKLKDLLKESYVWERKFGESLPTLDDVIKKKQEKSNEITEDTLTENNWDKIQIPATVKRWMNRFIDAMNAVKLERIKKMAILFHIIKALGLDPQELNTYVQRIRRGLK
tara:strand:- start:625 stop:966 length:342 start_codon:yes stop_codon:yes gene_type:complete